MLKTFENNLNNSYKKGRAKQTPWRLRNSSGTEKPFKIIKKRKKSSLFFTFFSDNSFKKRKSPGSLQTNMKKNLIFQYYLRNYLFPHYKATA